MTSAEFGLPVRLGAVRVGRVQQQRGARGLVFLEQLCDFLVVGVRVQRLVVLVVLVFVVRSALEPLRLRVLLLLGGGHLCRVLLPPLRPPVLEPHLRRRHTQKPTHISDDLAFII